MRVLLDQHRADRRAGLRTATLVSGYQGSPLGGPRPGGRAAAGRSPREHEIVLRRAVNEELGATAVSGSQLAPIAARRPLRRRRRRLVRQGARRRPRRPTRSATRNLVGTDPRGGVLALCGDDPASQVLDDPERLGGAARGAARPGARARAASRRRSTSAATRSPARARQRPVVGAQGRHQRRRRRRHGARSAPARVTPVDAGARMGGRAVRAPPLGARCCRRSRSRWSARWSRCASRSPSATRSVNGLNRVVCDAPGARAWASSPPASAPTTCCGALDDLGLDERPVRRAGDRDALPARRGGGARASPRGLEEIVVIEEKGPFLERLVRDALYGGPATPPVLGARDDRGAPLVPAHGALDADAIARVDRRARARPRGRAARCASASSARRASTAAPRGRRSARRARRSSAPAARTTRAWSRPTTRSSAPASAATRW